MQYSGPTTWTDSCLFSGHRDSPVLHRKPDVRRRRNLCDDCIDRRNRSDCSVDDEPFLIMQNPADVVGETVIDCRPSVLPVSIPLSGLSPATISEARECVSYRPSEETGKSIMDMDTNEITINRIVGFEWDEAGTDLEDEMPTPVSSPTQIVVPVIPPAGTADPFGWGDGFDWTWPK